MGENSPLELLILFLVGILQELLLTRYWKAVQNNHKVKAAMFSGAIAILGVLVIANVLSKSGVNNMGASLIVYAAGKSTGTYLSLRFLK